MRAHFRRIWRFDQYTLASMLTLPTLPKAQTFKHFKHQKTPPTAYLMEILRAGGLLESCLVGSDFPVSPRACAHNQQENSACVHGLNVSSTAHDVQLRTTLPFDHTLLKVPPPPGSSTIGPTGTPTSQFHSGYHTFVSDLCTHWQCNVSMCVQHCS